MKKILIIDDDIKLCELLSRFLAGRGYSTITANEGASALELIANKNPDLALLDIMMPGDDGFEVLKKIRKFSNLPVIMLTARGDTTDRVVGLEMGADDYIPKPFEPVEVDARIRAILRRVTDTPNTNKGDAKKESSKVDTFSQFTVNHNLRNLLVEEKTVELTSLEYSLLKMLIDNAGQALHRDRIIEELHGEEFDLYNRSVDILVSRLRKKLNDNPKNPEIIKTLHGHGYLFIAKRKSQIDSHS